jgi:hypothetical protein
MERQEHEKQTKALQIKIKGFIQKQRQPLGSAEDVRSVVVLALRRLANEYENEE